MADGTLVGSNVLLDILAEDPVWKECSTDAFAYAADFFVGAHAAI